MDTKTAKTVKKFVNRLKRKLKIEHMLLFGSRARGNNFITSDYDFIIVSPDFAGLKIYERMAKIYDFWSSPQDVEPLCYTPEEFEKRKKGLGIVAVAVKEGKRII